MGECVLASNNYAKEAEGDFVFCVLRMMWSKNKSLYGSLPVAVFKEKDQNGWQLNNHCFLLKKNKIIDPMFKVLDADMTSYLKELSKHVELRPDLRYILVDIQKLKEDHRVDNRSEWNEYDPILLGCYWFDIQTQKVDEAW